MQRHRDLLNDSSRLKLARSDAVSVSGANPLYDWVSALTTAKTISPLVYRRDLLPKISYNYLAVNYKIYLYAP